MVLEGVGGAENFATRLKMGAGNTILDTQVKVSLSQSQLCGQSLLCQRIYKECHIFVSEFYNVRQPYEYKVF